MKITFKRHGTFLFAVSVILLITLISFFAALIFTNFRLTSPSLPQVEPEVRIEHVNQANVLESLNSFLRAYYDKNEEQSVHISFEEQFTLQTIAQSPKLQVKTLPPQISTNEQCTHHKCLDLYQCETSENLLKIYVYPIRNIINQTTGESLISEFTKEYYELLMSIVQSPFYTNEISKACFFHIPLDTLNERSLSQPEQISALFSLYPFYRKHNGSNHVFFNFIPRSQHKSGLNIGNAMHLSGGLDSFSHRRSFDVALPVYSPLSARAKLNNVDEKRAWIEKYMKKQRAWKIVVIQAHELTARESIELEQLERSLPKDELLLFYKCDPLEGWIKDIILCNAKNSIRMAYSDVIANSRFCLLMSTITFGGHVISDTLMYGCIPILMFSDLVLPLQPKLDWNRASLRIPEQHLSKLKQYTQVAILKEQQLRSNGLHYWIKYFSSVRVIVRSALFMLNERVFPQTALSQERWSAADLSFDLLQCFENTCDSSLSQTKLTSKTLSSFNLLNDNVKHWKNIDNQFGKIHAQSQCIQTQPPGALLNAVGQTLITSPLGRTGFTAVILSYNRLDSLLDVVKQVTLVPSCLKVIIVWNSVQTSPPTSEQLVQSIQHRTKRPLRVPIHVIQTLENKLSNRFYPFTEIETSAILALDDDIAMLNADELEFAFQVWREFPDRIVGFPSRLHVFDNRSNVWKYESEWVNQVSMILLGAAFYHKHYGYMYTFEMASEIRDWVDSHVNCEDIAMNFLVSSLTNKAPIKVTPRKKFKCSECGQMTMISEDVIQHLAQRSECINHFVRVFGGMPLKSVEFRLDPVLFKDSLPQKLKKFNDVGNI